MITRLYVDNFRCLVNFELKFQDFTLLAGLNGSGKSSVLDVMYALQLLLSGQANINHKHVLPNASRTRWSERDTQVVELNAQVGDEEMRYRLKVQHEAGGARHESSKSGFCRRMDHCSCSRTGKYNFTATTSARDPSSRRIGASLRWLASPPGPTIGD
ncbi:ATP-binding protein [uncultured Thiodictyon sp.]|uniref:ATP-binding protein n=1 Tax=uncultured Thiodictyon sp. TaxID=1846217 RepID=UPI0025F42171|nr:ATP-binding protein [uncultured Thiodictyon sp.]